MPTAVDVLLSYTEEPPPYVHTDRHTGFAQAGMNFSTIDGVAIGFGYVIFGEGGLFDG